MNERTGIMQGARTTVTFLAGFLVTLFAVDAMLALFETPEIYGSTNRARWKWQLLEKTPHSPDVVVLGSSHEVHAVNPDVVDATVKKVTGQDLKTLNLAASASSMLTQYLFVRKLVEEGQRPKLVYLGITPQAVDDWMHPWIKNGLRALGDRRDVTLAWHGGPELLHDSILRGSFKSYHLWHDIRLIAERIVIAAPIMPRTRLKRYDNGWAEWRGEQPGAQGKQQQEMNEPNADRMNPDNINGRALTRAIHLLRKNRIRVRLIELPLSSNARPYTDPARNRDYRKFVQHIVRNTGVEIVRPPEGLLTDRHFWDDVHLNRPGAEKLSAWLAADIVQQIDSRHVEKRVARTN